MGHMIHAPLVPQILTCSNREIRLSWRMTVYISYWAIFVFSVYYIESPKHEMCLKLRTVYLADNVLGRLLESIWLSASDYGAV